MTEFNPSLEPPSAEAAPRAMPSRRLLVGLGAGVLTAALAVGFVIHRGAERKTEPPIVADVPRADGGAILFSKSFAERAGIKTVTAQKAPLTPAVKVVGTVTFDPEHVAAVGTRIRGLVRKLKKLEGDHVKAGDMLAEIESAELGQAQASIAMLEAQRKAAESNARRERDLARQKLSTAREAELAEATLSEYRAMLAAAQQKVAALGGASGNPFGVYLVRAPLAGTVVERRIAAGQSVDDNIVAFRIANLDHLWVELAVFERNLGAMRKGDAVEVRSLADPDQILKGQVAYVGDQVDETTRSAAVRIEIDNKERKLRPGQSVTAIIHASGPARRALLVPLQAVTFIDGKPTVFVAEGEGRVVPTPVELGASDGASQEITAGLKEGAQIVGEGVFALKSELFR